VSASAKMLSLGSSFELTEAGQESCDPRRVDFSDMDWVKANSLSQIKGFGGVEKALIPGRSLFGTRRPFPKDMSVWAVSTRRGYHWQRWGFQGGVSQLLCPRE
jgi:hypothetical protein